MNSASGESRNEPRLFLSRFFPHLANFVVDRPWTIFTFVVVLSLIAVSGFTHRDDINQFFEQRAKTGLAESNPFSTMELPPDVDPVSLTNSHAVILVRSDQFFSQEGAEAMRGLVAQLEDQDHISGVLWMDRVPILNIFGLPEPLLPRATASQTRFDLAKEKALKHPLLAGQLLSEDAKHMLLLVQFDFLFVEDDTDCTSGLKAFCEQAIQSYPAFDASFWVTGRVPLYVAAIQNRDENTLKYQIIAYSMIGLMAIILFRGLTAVLIVALAPTMGVFWSLGIIRFLELEHNPFNQVVVPVLISLVALTDGVHLMVQIRRRRSEGHSPKEAARLGVSEVGLACFLTSLTTAVGFASLQFSHSDIVREFGTSCVVGVAVTFVAVITTIPLACSCFGGNLHKGHEKGFIDRNLKQIGVVVEWVLHNSKAISLVAIAGTVAMLVVSSTLRPDEKLSNNFPESTGAVIGLKEMDRAFNGLEVARVDVRWSENIESNSPQILAALRSVDAVLNSHPELGTPISLCNLVDALPGEGAHEDRMLMLELLPPPLKRAFFTPEYRHALVNFRVQDKGIAEYGPVFAKIEKSLVQLEQEHPGFTFHLDGRPVWRWRNLYRVVVDLAISLGTATLIIFGILAIVYRSFRIGLISLVPNLFPLAVTGTYLVMYGQKLEMVSVCAFTVCLGIAVDDTIHFMTRYVEERRLSGDSESSIRTAFSTVGTSLIMTTIVLCAGFSTVLWSDAREHRIFGAMSGLTIASALFADLVFLPALLARFERRKHPDSNPKSDSAPNP